MWSSLNLSASMMKGSRSLSLNSSFHRLPSIFEISALWMVAKPALSCRARIFRRSICDQRMKAFIGRLMCCCPIGVELGEDDPRRLKELCETKEHNI